MNNILIHNLIVLNIYNVNGYLHITEKWYVFLMFISQHFPSHIDLKYFDMPKIWT